jgi:hypothetical protein
MLALSVRQWEMRDLTPVVVGVSRSTRVAARAAVIVNVKAKRNFIFELRIWYENFV